MKTRAVQPHQIWECGCDSNRLYSLSSNLPQPPFSLNGLFVLLPLILTTYTLNEKKRQKSKNTLPPPPKKKIYIRIKKKLRNQNQPNQTNNIKAARAKLACGLTVATGYGTNAGSEAPSVHDQTENEDHPGDRVREEQERRRPWTRIG